MSIPAEVTTLIAEEEAILERVLDSLRAQLEECYERFDSEQARSRGLTANLVAATRDEDKQMIASDEAVSYQLKDMKHDEIEKIQELLTQPYFARIIIEEIDQKGTRNIEYKLGQNSNVDCRIIDWRKGPIAKLFYEYEEGDEYSELIQGQERLGHIRLKNKVEIVNEELVRLACRYGNFVKDAGSWRQLRAGEKFNRRSSQAALPDVRALMTPEQFQLVTEDPDTPLLLKGRAGSGKTTVALHRLDWLLKEHSDKLTTKDCLVLVQSGGLKSYIKNALHDTGQGEVPVLAFDEWLVKLTKKALNIPESEELARPEAETLPGTLLVKQSPALVQAIETKAKQHLASENLIHFLLSVLADEPLIIQFDKSGFVDRDRIKAAYQETKANLESNQVAQVDEPLIVYAALLLGKLHKQYKHMIVDEVQDVTPPQLAAALASLDSMHHVTLVGDEAQGIREQAQYFGWDDIKQLWNTEESLARLATLSVSHRSTQPIMNLADYVAKRKFVRDGRPGKVPIWFHCKHDEQAVTEAIAWLDRVASARQGSLTVVVCRDRSQALNLVSMLEPTFGPAARFGDRNSLSFDDGILVTEARAVKGLEFPHILIWDPSSKNYPDNTTSRALLYVAMSRAEDLLALVSWGKVSTLLPPMRSKLVRGINRSYDLDEEEDEQQERFAD